MYTNHTTQLQIWIDLARDGDAEAHEQLISVACGRLRLLTHNMLAGDRLRRWEETDDVLQLALLRLQRDLERVQPDTLRQFLSLAALRIRRVLIDLARHYYGPLGPGANQQVAPAETDASALYVETPDSALSASQGVMKLEAWQELHEAIEALSDEEREVVDLLWFHELTQVEAASLIGVDVRTVQRRWQRARLRLFEALRQDPAV